DLFFVKICSGGTFRNFSPARSHARGEEQRRHQLRFSGAAVTYNANVSDVLGVIDFHTDLPFCAATGEQVRSVPDRGNPGFVSTASTPSGSVGTAPETLNPDSGAGLRLDEFSCWGRRAWPLYSPQAAEESSKKRFAFSGS